MRLQTSCMQRLPQSYTLMDSPDRSPPNPQIRPLQLSVLNITTCCRLRVNIHKLEAGTVGAAQADGQEPLLSQASNSIAGSVAGGGTIATQQTSRGALDLAHPLSSTPLQFIL